jgi:MoaA/NifB/PqqE/SkfB family radical SAM enzyme
MIEQAEIHWHLTDICNAGCDYCPSRYQAGSNKRTTDEYLTVIEKLQASRYKHAKSIKWKIGGGEPLHFTNLNILLRKIKSMPSFVRLDTSGGETWFDLLETKDYVDQYKLTHHDWQNISVVNFIADFCKENGKDLQVIVPLIPGKIFEKRELIEELKSNGISAHEQVLFNDAKFGDFWNMYSTIDINRILGRPDNWEPEPVVHTEPVYEDPRIPPVDDTPSYTGLGCYTGIDHLYISHKGYASGSDCGGRDIGNVFHDNWQAPDKIFTCNMNYCRSDKDRRLLRVGVPI